MLHRIKQNQKADCGICRDGFETHPYGAGEMVYGLYNLTE